MKRLALALILLAAFVSTTKHLVASNTSDIKTSFLPSDMLVEPARRVTQKTRFRMYDMLCFELRDIDCTGVPAPKVKQFTPNRLRTGLAGYYDGSDTIFVRSNLRGHLLEEVLAHEMSHYLDVMVNGLTVPGYAEPICYSEKDAWAVSDAFWIKYGYPNRTVGSRWADWYTHCTKFKDEMYPDE